jgi:hypothetical protein
MININKTLRLLAVVALLLATVQAVPLSEREVVERPEAGSAREGSRPLGRALRSVFQPLSIAWDYFSEGGVVARPEAGSAREGPRAARRTLRRVFQPLITAWDYFSRTFNRRVSDRPSRAWCSSLCD